MVFDPVAIAREYVAAAADLRVADQFKHTGFCEILLPCPCKP